MVRRYCHFSTKQLVAQMMKQAGLKEEEIKQGKTCPRCGETNNINAEVCVKCQQILDYKKLMREVEEKERGRSKLAAEIKELREENENLIKKQEKEIDRLKQELTQVSRKVDSILVDSGEVIVDKVTGKIEIIKKGPRRILNGEIGKAEVIDMRDKKSK